MIGLGSQYLTAAGFGRYRITAASLGNLVMLWDWLKFATQQAILAAFGDDGMAVIKATNEYLNGIAASDRDKAQALADLINEDPMMVCSLGLEPQGVTMPGRYIISDGNQYINTGISANTDNYVKAIIQLTGTVVTNYQDYMGGSNGDNRSSIRLREISNASTIEICYRGNYGSADNLAYNTDITTEWKDDGAYVNGTKKANKGTSLGTGDMFLFAFQAGGGAFRKSSVKFREFYVENMQQLVPFKKKDGDNVINCMLDLSKVGVEGATLFYYNQGTGQFTIPDISYTPSTP